VIAVHKILSVGVANNKGFEKCFVRADSSHEASVDLIEKFVDALEELYEIDQMYIPNVFHDALDLLEADIAVEDSKFKKMELQSLKNHLDGFLKMDVFGYNSGRFDLTVLSPYLLPEMKRRYEKIQILKKDNDYISIVTDFISFKDAYRFTSPVPLSCYLRQNSVLETKSIFPYTHYNSVEDLRNAVDFPPHSAFYSDLKKKNVPHKEYIIAKNEYERRRSLPDADPKKMRCMVDWLIYYNLLDCRPLADAINNSFQNFFSIFKIDPSWCISLPAYSSKCMFLKYSKLHPLCYSFNDKMDDLRLEFKF
jgi:hypothetical protein